MTYRIPWKLIRGLTVTAGAGLILIALMARPLGLDSSPGLGKGELLLLLAGSLVLLVALLGKRLPAAYRSTAIVLLNTLLLLACLELGATVVSTLRTFNTHPADWPVNYPELPYYETADWGRAHWNEIQASGRLLYVPYVVWNRPPFQGHTININQHNLRNTPGAQCEDEAYHVFVFGGSTMWGWGSPDESTIAAFLQQGLAEKQAGPVCVTNFGETAYVSTQGLIALQRQLQQGNRPDRVLFYDGVNDIFAAYQSGKAGTHQNEDAIAARFNRRKYTLLDWLQSSATLQLLKALSPPPQHVSYETRGLSADSLAHAVTQAYITNYKMVEALAEQYGFQYHFFWQPSLSIGSKPLTKVEQSFYDMLDPALLHLSKATYREVENVAAELEHLSFLATVFDNQEGLLWIDGVGHVIPEGNQLIAQEMLRRLP